SLEAKVETDSEVRRRCKRLERRRRVAGRAERLRVHARVLRPQDAEVACGKRDRRVPGAERADPRAGWNHDQAELAQPQEVTLLEEAADRAARMQTHQLRACLIVVRRVRV